MENMDKYFEEVEEMHKQMEASLTEEEKKYFNMYKRFVKLLDDERRLEKTLFMKHLDD